MVLILRFATLDVVPLEPHPNSTGVATPNSLQLLESQGGTFGTSVCYEILTSMRQKTAEIFPKSF